MNWCSPDPHMLRLVRRMMRPDPIWRFGPKKIRRGSDLKSNSESTPMPVETKLRKQAQFLADRLAELDFGGVPDVFWREWDGHVAPALARLNDTLAEASNGR